MNHECPSCRSSEQVRVSRPRGSLEKRIFPWLLLRPLRCRKCSRRFLRFGIPGGLPGRSGRRGPLRRSPRMDGSRGDPGRVERDREELMAQLREAELEVFPSEEGAAETPPDGPWSAAGPGRRSPAGRTPPDENS